MWWPGIPALAIPSACGGPSCGRSGNRRRRCAASRAAAYRSRLSWCKRHIVLRWVFRAS
ncbi:hypothetical protein CBM2623_A120017 [Cupriavidus taiwanensis]|nr:hypothetical protein CBM2608_A100017 [Cupriavidus taiwanensis]SPA25495.1 hypothetical protein CBM2623_A120017 [Cupriavidus taiwanensis]